MSTNSSHDKKSEELNDSQLDNVAGGAGHPGVPWEPHMGDIDPNAPSDEPGPIQEEERTGLPKDDGMIDGGI